MERLPTIAIAAIGIGMIDQAMTFQPGNRAVVQRRRRSSSSCSVALLLTKRPTATGAATSRRGRRPARSGRSPRSSPGSPRSATRAGCSACDRRRPPARAPPVAHRVEDQPRRRHRHLRHRRPLARRAHRLGRAGEPRTDGVRRHRRGRRRRAHREPGLGHRDRAARRRRSSARSIAVVIGYPAIRRGGLTLPVITLAFALLTSSYLLNQEFFDWLAARAAASSDPTSSALIDISTRDPLLLLLPRRARADVRRRSRPAAQPHRPRADRDPGERARGARATASTRPARRSPRSRSPGSWPRSPVCSTSTTRTASASRPSCPNESLIAFSMVVIGGLGSLAGALHRRVLRARRAVLPARQLGAARERRRPAARPDDPARRHRRRDRATLRDGYLRWVARRRDLLVPSLVADRRVEEPVSSPPSSARPRSRPPRARASWRSCHDRRRGRRGRIGGARAEAA